MSKIERRWKVEGLSYGFVYKWKDTIRGRYYIGSHWGKFDDGYVCSSRIMRKVYRRRPDTFTRRILAVVTTNRLDLLDREQAALDKIPRNHFGTKAYNVSVKVHKPWWAKGSKLRKKTVDKLKRAWQNPERRKEASLVASARRASPELKAKMSKSARRRWRDPEERRRQSEVKKGCRPGNAGTKGLVVAWNKGTHQPALSKKHRAKISASLVGRARPPEVVKKLKTAAEKRWQSAEYRAKISASRAAARARGECKVTPKQAMRIRTLRSSKKYTLDTLGSKFGVSASYIHGVIHDAKWDSAIRALNT